MKLANWFVRKQHTTIRRQAGYRPWLENLEDRVTPAAITYVNDNWFLVTDNNTPGLSVGDIVDNRLDTGGPATVTATYGADGFGTVGGVSLAGSATINNAIGATDVGGTTNVLQGNYTEAVLVNKSIALIGAQSNTSAVTRFGTAVPESVLSADSGLGIIDITANDAVVSGFTVQNNASGPGIASAATVSGSDIRNNISQNNEFGILLASSGASLSIVEQNVLSANNQFSPPGGVGLLALGNLSNASIRFNEFTGNNSAGVQLFGSGASAITNVSLLGNQFAANDQLQVVNLDNSQINGNIFTASGSVSGSQAALHIGGGSDNLDINFNTFTNLGFPAIAADTVLAITDNSNLRLIGNTITQDVSLFTATNPVVDEIDIASALGVNIISQNAVSLSGTASGGVTAINGIHVGGANIGTVNITGNVILADGINGSGSTNLLLSDELTSTSVINVTSNTFSGGALGVDVIEGVSGLPALHINLNNIVNHTTAGLTTQATDTLDAAENFWGSLTGPTTPLNPPGTGDHVTSGLGTLNLAPFRTAAQLPFGDGFTAPTGSSLGNEWIPALGSFSVQSNALVAGAAPISLAALGVPTLDATVQANVTLAGGNSHAGLVARYTGPGDQNMYLAMLIRDSGIVHARIYRITGASIVQLNDAVVSVSSATLRFEVFGSSLRLFVNGALAVQATDTAIAGPGLVGVQATPDVAYDNFTVGLTPSAAASLPFADNFTLPTGSLLGGAWTSALGSFTIQANAAVGAAARNIATIAGATSDVSLQLTTTLTANNNAAGLIARYSGPGDSNHYLGLLLKLNGLTYAEIFRNVNGVYTLLNFANVTASGAVTLRFDVIGSSLQLFVNGVLAASATDTALSAGQVGVYATATVPVDSFSATQRLPLLAPGSFQDSFPGIAGSALGDFWRQQLGTISIQGGAASLTGPVNLATLIQAPLDDVSESANVTLNSANGSSVGLVARDSGPGQTNLYLASLTRSNGMTVAQIWRNVMGVWTLLSTANVGAVTSATLRFDVIGSSLKLFVNGALTTFTFDTALTSGAVGIRGTAGATVDNFNNSLKVPVAPPLPVTDGFNVTSDNQLSANWREQVGNYSVQTSAAVGQAMSNLATVTGVTLTNSSESMNVTFGAADASADLVARYSGPGEANMYVAHLQQLNGQLTAYIFLNLNGTWIKLASNPVTASGTITLRFDVLGNSLRFYVNGDLAAFAFDSNLTSGQVGIRSSTNVSLDNFNVATA